jgi:hypothetical protein
MSGAEAEKLIHDLRAKFDSLLADLDRIEAAGRDSDAVRAEAGKIRQKAEAIRKLLARIDPPAH